MLFILWLSFERLLTTFAIMHVKKDFRQVSYSNWFAEVTLCLWQKYWNLTCILDFHLELPENSLTCNSFPSDNSRWSSSLVLFIHFVLGEIYFMFFVVQIREFEYSPEAQESRKQEFEKLIQDQESKRRSLLQWCYASYGEVHWVFKFSYLI